MGVTVKLFDIKEVRRELLRSNNFYDYASDIALQAYADVKKIIEAVYAPTLDIGDGASHYTSAARRVLNELGKPKLEVNLWGEVFEITSRGLRLKIETYVRRENSPDLLHNLWYWLDRGTQDISSWRGPTTPPFQRRNPNRTRPKSTSVQPFQSSGQWQRIGTGQPRKGIEAREWSFEIGKEVQQIVESSEIAGLTGWTVLFTLHEPELENVRY